MRRVRIWLGILMVFVVMGVMVFMCNGCKKSEPSGSSPTSAMAPATAGAATVPLCTKCGQVAGGPTCCQPDAEKCGGCELDKGSPGCCNIPKDTKEAAVCTKCGHIAGSNECCAGDHEKCAACGLDKGSAGCCKLGK